MSKALQKVIEIRFLNCSKYNSFTEIWIPHGCYKCCVKMCIIQRKKVWIPVSQRKERIDRRTKICSLFVFQFLLCSGTLYKHSKQIKIIETKRLWPGYLSCFGPRPDYILEKSTVFVTCSFADFEREIYRIHAKSVEIKMYGSRVLTLIAQNAV